MSMNARLVQAVLAAAACGVALCGVTAWSAGAASAQPAASVELTLGASHPLAAEAFSPENLRISNPGGALADARISFVFGEQPLPGPGQLRWAVKLQRFDPANRSWVSVPLSDLYGPVHDGSYTTSLPAGVSVEQLRVFVDPETLPLASRQIPVTVTVAGSGDRSASLHTSLPVVLPKAVVTSAPRSISRNGQGEIDFTLDNPSAQTYPSDFVFLEVLCNTSTVICPGAHPNNGIAISWYQDGSWHPLAVEDSSQAPIAYYMKVATIKLPPGARQFRFLLGFGSGLNSRATSATIMFQAGLPPAPGAQGSPWSLAQAQTTVKVG
jgi:hypothetical protein